jgi:hypothetical protein
MVFEQLDLPAQRRLRHVQALGGAPEVQFFRNRDETADLADLEHRSP